MEEVRRALDIEPGPGETTPDVATALTSDASKRSFVVVENDDALAAMLDAPLEKWRIFLHPSQRKLVERSWSGPVRVLGGAGTGKTVTATGLSISGASAGNYSLSSASASGRLSTPRSLRSIARLRRSVSPIQTRWYQVSRSPRNAPDR